MSSCVALTVDIQPNIKTRNDGNSPLHIAVQNADLKAIAVLIKYGADPSVGNTAYASPMTLAELSNPTVARLLKPENRFGY